VPQYGRSIDDTYLRVVDGLGHHGARNPATFENSAKSGSRSRRWCRPIAGVYTSGGATVSG
jgi:hypothetical protein